MLFAKRIIDARDHPVYLGSRDLAHGRTGRSGRRAALGAAPGAEGCSNSSGNPNGLAAIEGTVDLSTNVHRFRVYDAAIRLFCTAVISPGVRQRSRLTHSFSLETGRCLGQAAPFAAAAPRKVAVTGAGGQTGQLAFRARATMLNASTADAAVCSVCKPFEWFARCVQPQYVHSDCNIIGTVL